jgi:hypothetical protein
LYFVELNIGEIMDVMNDLLNLKLAIQSNREHVENIYELYKNELPSFSHTFSKQVFPVIGDLWAIISEL